MYSFDDVLAGIKHPELAVSKLNGVINHLRVGERYYPFGIDVFEKDWDNLVILDACRYDCFEEQVWFEGRTSKCISRGTTSREFIRGNFTERTAHDVVYLSANPWYMRLHEEIGAELHDYVNLHDEEHRDAADGLTTLPETVTRHAMETAEKYPNKRLIVHYMQPHQPFLSEFGREKFDARKDTMLTVKLSDVTRNDVIQAYRENLDLVLREVVPLFESLVGKTVITSDHGELLGESQRPIPVRGYGHPGGVYIDPLLEVPWHVIDADDRKEVVEESPVGSPEAEIDDDDVERQLEALGYRP